MPDPSQEPVPAPPNESHPADSDAATERAEPSPRAADPRRQLRLYLVTAFVLVGLAIAAVWADSRNRLREVQVEFARRLQDADHVAQEAERLARATQDGARDLQSKLGVIEGRLADAQSQQAALEELYRELAPGRDDWTIAEVEQVLLLASQQLQLAGNVRGALTALQLADSRLQRLDRPQFLPLRRALARDMERLKAMPFVDVTGIALRIDQILSVVEQLPLAIEARVGEETPASSPTDGSVVRLAREVWADIRKMVRIENMQRTDIPVLMPAQVYYLRENLRLRLLSARIAFLSRDEQTFRADLAAAEAWLRRYFDVSSKQAAGALLTLGQLQKTEVPTDMPDLNASLEAIRTLKATRERSMR